MSEVIWDGPHSIVTRDDKWVYKEYKCFLEYGIQYREEWWLRKLGFKATWDGERTEMVWMGRPLSQGSMPPNVTEQMDVILWTLEQYNCCHNDIRPENLLVKNREIYLIDFGWATHKWEPVHKAWPEKLGSTFKHPDGFDDEHSLRKSIEWIQNGGKE